MSELNHTVEPWNALPEVDRTTDKVHSKLIEQGHRISFGEVRTVLWATVVSEKLDENDVLATAKTLKLLLEFLIGSFGREEIGKEYTDFAECMTEPLTSMFGSDARDLTQVLAHLFAFLDEVMENEREHKRMEELQELWSKGDDKVMPFE